MTTPADYPDLLAVIADGFTALPDKPEETPESTLRAMWCKAMGTPVSAETALSTPLRELDQAEKTVLQACIARWQHGEPLAHITARQHFCGLDLQVGPQALVPRKETEILARAAMDKIAAVGRDHPAQHPLIIDVCTGCGNLPLTFAFHFPDAKVYAADLAPEAVALAEQNARFTGLEQQVHFACGDLLAPLDALGLEGKVHVLTCNPPYISSKKVTAMAEEISRYEPSMAFDGGPFGISILQRILKDALVFLKPGGWLLFEVGLGQGPSLVKKIERTPDYDTVETRHDEAGEIRVIAARKAHEETAP